MRTRRTRGQRSGVSYREMVESAQGLFGMVNTKQWQCFAVAMAMLPEYSEETKMNQVCFIRT